MPNLNTPLNAPLRMAFSLLALALSSLSSAAVAATDSISSSAAAGAIIVGEPAFSRTPSTLAVDMTLDLSAVKVKSEEQIAITPVLVNGDISRALPGFIVTGRNRAIRGARAGIATPEGYTAFRSGKAPDALPYRAEIPLEDWMLDANLILADTLSGCNCKPLATAAPLIANVDLRPRLFTPEWVYVEPKAEVEKIREAAGHAYIDFPVNRTEIYPDYRRNPVELANIRDTIELIKNDPDYTITSLTVKGYASPEGSYANNERLAQGRTEALLAYIRDIYSFPAALLHSSWQAEDWQGLIDYLRTSDLPNRDAMLRICTDPVFDGNDDGREWRLKSSFPQQYKFLLAEVYPALRHTDYTVRYTVRSFTSLAEIRSVMDSDPRKLSLSELYLLAQSIDSASPEYARIMELAVTLYPDDPAANLNAALCALRADELDRAAARLDRAGDSPEATYARAILAAKQGRYDAAAPLFDTAARAGITAATDAARQASEIARKSPKL